VVAFIVIAALALILDGLQFRNQRTEKRIFSDTESVDFGLLSILGLAENRSDARALHRMLTEAGIRATMTPHPAGTSGPRLHERPGERPPVMAARPVAHVDGIG